MRMKKLFAGLAAAATLLSGLALGAAPASAASDGLTTVDAQAVGATITFNAGSGELSGVDQFKATDAEGGSKGFRQFKYVKLASYETSTADSGKYLKSAVDNNSQAVKNAFKALGQNDAASLKPDPFTWLGSQKENAFSAEQLKNFAAALETLAITPVEPTLNRTTLEFNFTDPGFYLIVDVTGEALNPTGNGNHVKQDGNCVVTYHKISPVLIGTELKLNGDSSASDGIQTIAIAYASGTANVKQTGEKSCLPSGGFTKTDENGNGLSGQGNSDTDVRFDVYTADNSPANDTSFKSAVKAITADKLFTVPAGFNSYELSSSEPKNRIAPDDTGKVNFGTLPAGTYYVYESVMPSVTNKSYLTDYRAVLKVVVTEGANGANGTFTITDLNETGLLTGDSTSGYKYKNITSITQLPKTGAAGTAIFTVIAALIAGAAVTVYLKSRATKRQLMA